MMKQNVREIVVQRVGWFASVMGICMFVSFVDQIRLNLAGQPGSVLLAAATLVNCTAWTAYGWFKAKKDWLLICSSGLGIVVAAVTMITGLMAVGGE